ncbi:MAG: septum formation initiator family protein [Pseudomonadales bacterium]|nr:septum formation initiator family protein [Pseudomonadales bacterium]MDA0761638.1 septum formation initiator family protein [Pseudomonadota bacterium]MDA0956611.1 septum formation initiator family protein [Pseudomonadota bacterium]MDA1208043.1 septum formation initiator family protein [Pseudomonadota bacterium]
MNFAKVLFAALLLIGFYLQFRLWTGEGSYAHVSALQLQLDGKVASNEVKSARNRLLRAEIIDLRQGLEAVEERARTEFGLIKEDETFILLLDD